MQATTFNSKIDLWFIVIAIVASAIVGIAVLHLKGSRTSIAINATVSLVPIVLFIWLPMFNTCYTLSTLTLKIKSGLFLTRTIAIDQIERIEKTRDLDASPALSLDRIRISYREDGEAKNIMISPADQATFLAKLSSLRNKQHR